MMAQAAAVWCLNPNSRLARKLAKIQRPFLLAISGAYRTSPTAALQTILGIPPLHLKLQAEARMTILYSLQKQTIDIIIQPEDLEQRKVGWSSHPSRYLCLGQLLLDFASITSTNN
ncbi:hypothetical protein AVEN_275255-1 [Araneus ventricosus]|uniref:Uncharacterized protein n=1 Tax=Araneus ventricosus TaxID=182803 RepID=A0A4Y2M695_ARAVE|nr:hypothetical protein AVEN_275255-1 [Araneus ventricosus]